MMEMEKGLHEGNGKRGHDGDRKKARWQGIMNKRKNDEGAALLKIFSSQNESKNTKIQKPAKPLFQP